MIPAYIQSIRKQFRCSHGPFLGDAQTSNFGEKCDKLNSNAGRVSEEPPRGVFERPLDIVAEEEASLGDIVLSLDVSRSASSYRQILLCRKNEVVHDSV